jgi:hypothetical protein
MSAPADTIETNFAGGDIEQKRRRRKVTTMELRLLLSNLLLVLFSPSFRWAFFVVLMALAMNCISGVLLIQLA